MAEKIKNENASENTQKADVVDTEKTADEVSKEVEVPVVEPPKKVMVKLPLLRDQNANQDVFVSVNFKNYIIRRGVFVEVPKEVEEVLRNSEQAEEAAWKYAVDNKLREAK